MIQITIGSAERQFSSIRDIDEGWINQHVNRRKNDGQNVCVEISIEEPPINMHLCTPACSVGRGGCRPPNPQESKIFELWRKQGLNQMSFSGGNVVAFLKKLRNILN